MDEDGLRVAVTTINIPTQLQQSVWTGEGEILDEDGIGTGAMIRFGGDWRMMREIKYALDADESPVAIVPDWAVMGRWVSA